ncbi:MAG: nucleotidyltransferase domain-containing protein [Syntrophomonadaceae bacterium]|jgi:predicted nucleotidyltransferase|nr:nucleotidyltransferase domain-containing protein [Syntrophomonadaceae bacterium]
MEEVSLDLIEAMSRRIVEKFQPHKVIVFGSWARGEADIDAGVISRDGFFVCRGREGFRNPLKKADSEKISGVGDNDYKVEGRIQPGSGED